jgi:predicted nucleic acid-binding protein
LSVYLDTSALVKLYVDEDGSDAVWRLVGGDAGATCRITWAEALAALARRERESAPDAAGVWAVARQRLTHDWHALQIVEVTQPLVEQAGEFAQTFALRGYDAIQLAAGQALGRALTRAPVFVSFDRRLNRAARVLGLALPEGVPT